MAAVVLSANSTTAGEKFTITPSTNQVQLPKAENPIITTPSFFDSKISGGESTKGPVVPPPTQSLLVPNSKLEELMDQKKNWAFQSPNNIDRNRELEETLGVRKYEFDGLEKKSKGAVERYFERNQEKSDKPGSRPSSSTNSRDPMTANDPFNRSRNQDSPDDSLSSRRNGIIEELNPAYLFDWDMKPGAASAFGDATRVNALFPRGPAAGPASGRWLPGQQPNSTRPTLGGVERDWNVRPGPLGRLTDPINDPIDPTRSVLNPISARKAAPSSLPSTTSRSGDSFSFGSSAPVSTRPDFLNGSDSRPGGTFFQRPPAAGPASAPAPQPKPVILEIPRPKF